jgi:hypothetical protein
MGGLFRKEREDGDVFIIFHFALLGKTFELNQTVDFIKSQGLSGTAETGTSTLFFEIKEGSLFVKVSPKYYFGDVFTGVCEE